MSAGFRAALLVTIAACGASASPDLSVEADGPHQVGTTRVELTDAARNRALTAQLWFPTDAAAADVPIEMLEADPHRTQYAQLLAAAPSCPTRTVHVALDAAPAAGPWPLVAFSHCHDCVRFSEATVAARLASHGFVVVAVDHTGNTIYDHLAGHEETIGSEFLDVRAADIRFALDQVLAMPIAAQIDASRVGVFGHSFGGVTAGLVAQTDPRIRAALSIAAPMDNPLVPGVDIAQLHVPLAFIVAKEDNSITELGNKLIRDNNYAAATVPVWKLEVADAGHWSFSDVDGAADIFMAGCGQGTRQTDGTAFTYLDPPTGRALAAGFVTAFFEATLDGQDGARAYLDARADHRN
jgi:predicted dienelactone hydrolase